MRCVPYLLLFQSTAWPCLFGDLLTPIAFALLDAAIVMSDGYHHVADDVEPNYRGTTTVLRSYCCVSLDVPFNADDGRHAYRYQQAVEVIGVGNTHHRLMMVITTSPTALSRFPREIPCSALIAAHHSLRH